MTPTRPYLVRAVFEWILDNHCTPYLAVNTTIKGVDVPPEHISDGKIILNLSPSATMNMLIVNDSISFDARFSGVSRNLFIPMSAVLGIYAKENGEGMAFQPDEYEFVDEPSDLPPSPPSKPSGRPSLKVVK